MNEQVLAVLVVVGALAAALACGLYLSWRASRLHRLHQRVDRSRAGLRTALDRRRETAVRLSRALGGGHGRALAAAAAAAGPAGPDGLGGETAESALSRALRRALADPAALRAAGAAGLLPAAASAARGVHLARVFYNDAVSDTRRARRSRVVRLFRLSGGAPLPEFFEIDDLPPERPAPVPAPDTM
ncbi:hypothetical protein SAMN05421803_102346 [Nocardiopsis flavescens]|uniref:LemA family protein n=1 Tax=Nocardiopsis flavescens TaxID=758803 RepID=A0A1M6ENN4_9ACTN|nr:hypothetical protein [Nocardiopsis flavescens]SHI86938.1 hypothetical protein SAMN05421803_102346 [Nocardiopsis flavescens]